MNYLFDVAELEMKDLHHPYVGTEHILLAYLEIYNSKYIDAKLFKEYLISIIGVGSKDSEFVLYTPKARLLKDKCNSVKDIIISILNDSDSIGYNVLLSKGIDINNMVMEVSNSL